ncbi:CDP-glycerol glycerophosphotransferase family protein [Catellatospora sp. KI3]|uniref:bifunctional glycosyltransferase/CDP-glycerol:glycerophosphate glycerophosphotransferase n=1 Tax=Catellatospora sp. KI3 TaxID=3041620 RepID=UPI00248252D9|nr:CDP-glycerol glycerophosphotransferase family protein [Catellatospora sp. KI3]MDI1466371.1 CDP-glycerol glycerophosphotransferase family protein [Catellatospora sp. KI3]
MSVSIVLPAYRVQGYLRECLDSILGQQVAGLEVIAVDDASPDHCGDILDEYAARDGRLKVLHLARNVGLGRARNAGLAQATGDYVWFVDSDDALAPGALPLVDEVLRDRRPEVLLVDFERSYPIGRSRRSGLRRRLAAAPGPNGADVLARPGLLRTIHTAWNKIVSRELLARLDLSFAPGWYEDVSWTYPLLLGARRILALEEVCYTYRQRRQGAITHTRDARHMDVFDHWDRAWDRIDAYGDRVDPVRPVVFEQMIRHCMQTVGNEQRLPGHLRRASFLRAADLFDRHLPAGGFTPPPGKDGLRYRLVAARAWHAYAALRTCYRVERRAERAAAAARTGWRRVFPPRRPQVGLLDRAYYRFQTMLPVRDDLAAYAAYWYRGVSCNPAAIHARAKAVAPHVHGVWVVRPQSVAGLPPGTPHVVEGSAAYYRLLARAKYLVNNVNFPDFVRKRKGQVHLQTHHGTPVKTMGLDEQHHPAGERHNFGSLLRRSDRWDFSVSANPFSTQVWERAYPCPYEVLETGYPRNDRLARAGAQERAAARAALGLGQQGTVALYLPTFRPEPMALPRFDPAAVTAALGPDSLLLVRGHYLAQDTFAPGDRVRDLSSYPVVEDLYLAADLLISDYSSGVFDFAVLDRPIVLYVPDWAEYRGLRGAVLDIVAHAPGPVARSFPELVELLGGGGWRDDPARRAAFRETFCAWEDGHAAERVVRRVFLGESVQAPRPSRIFTSS